MVGGMHACHNRHMKMHRSSCRVNCLPYLGDMSCAHPFVCLTALCLRLTDHMVFCLQTSLTAAPHDQGRIFLGDLIIFCCGLKYLPIHTPCDILSLYINYYNVHIMSFLSTIHTCIFLQMLKCLMFIRDASLH